MRVKRILVNDFRAFPGPKDYEFPLHGKNLLLHGENGSGKSSILRALVAFFDQSSSPPGFATHRHVFTQTASGQPLETGKVAIEFDDGSGLHTWDIQTDQRPTSIPYAEAALRFGAIDYRAMLRTNFVHEHGTPNLWGLLVSGVLARMPVVLSGGRPSTLGNLVTTMHATVPQRHTARTLAAIRAAVQDVDDALTAGLPQVVRQANTLLAAFGDLGVTFDLALPPPPYRLTYDQSAREVIHQRIDFTATLHGHRPLEPQHFLNEARLSALALSIFLGSIKASTPPGIPGQPGPARLIILDDVLIGLDMSNRLPLLGILRDHFADWQIILLTHDSLWFEMAKEYTQHSGQWQVAKLFDEDAGPGHPSIPRLQACSDDLEVAEGHLKAGDLRAAAVYIRAAYEARLRGICEGTGIEITYRVDTKEISSDKLWRAILKRHAERAKNGKGQFVEPALISRISAVRSTVLNRLSHNGPSSLVAADVRVAMQVVRDFRSAQVPFVP